MADVQCNEVRLRDGRTLAYAECGSRAGKPIIYCHGAPSSRAECGFTIDGAAATEAGLRVIVPDRPGMGRSDAMPGRRIVDWPNDVLELADALGLETFAVVGSSGGAPYALACGALIANRVRCVGVLGGIAPMDAPGMMAAMSPQLRMMLRLTRFAPAIARGLFSLNLGAIRRNKSRAGEQMARWAAEPDRKLFQQERIANGFMGCFEEACRQGTRGPAFDVGLLARPWGFDLSAVKVPVVLWHGGLDRNVPIASGRYLAQALPKCDARFFDNEAHLSLPHNHQKELLAAVAGAA